jgi:hypothetical protein
MTNRREFLQIGIAASAWPLATQAAKAAEAAGAGLQSAEAVPLYKVVYDLRFADSLAFAQRVAALGIATHAIEGDMTRFWFDDLHHRWQRGPAAIAGLTAHGALFCLERLAWDQRMRVVFRAEHKLGATGCVEHGVSGPATLVRHAETRLSGEPDWSSSMADLVTRCPSGRAEIVQASCVGAPGNAPAPHGESLFSWVIAPASRA